MILKNVKIKLSNNKHVSINFENNISIIVGKNHSYKTYILKEINRLYNYSFLDMNINNPILYDNINSKFENILNKLLNLYDMRFDYLDKIFYDSSNNPIIHLSRGQKQKYIILYNSLINNILLIDDIESSLDIQSQREILNSITELSNCQIICTTNSPSIYYRGFLENVIRTENLNETI